MKKTKLEAMQQRLKNLRIESRAKRVEVWQLSNIHFRLVGRNTIDYWPSKGKAWVLGSRCSGFAATPAEVCEIAQFEW